MKRGQDLSYMTADQDHYLRKCKTGYQQEARTNLLEGNSGKGVNYKIGHSGLGCPKFNSSRHLFKLNRAHDGMCYAPTGSIGGRIKVEFS